MYKVPENCTVVDAQVGLYLCDYIPQYNSTAKSVLEIHRITEPFQSTNWKNDLTWSTKPAYEESMDYVTTHGNEISQYLYWNVTRAAKQWYEGSATNYGLVLTSDQTASTAYRAWFMYQSQAVFAVSYRDMTGIEGYYTYEDQSAVRAGTGHVGDYSGLLTIEKPDVSYPSTAFPYSVSHVFNSGLSSDHIGNTVRADVIIPDYSHMKLGWGWQLSAQESVKRTTISGTVYLVYRDGDGTQHYFLKDSSTGKFKDEDGLGLSIAAASSTADTGYTMTDDDGNTKYFRNGYLTYIQDANGNKICFLYNGASYSAGTGWYPGTSGNQLTSIVSVNKNQSAVTICTFTYNSNYYLTSMQDFAGRTTTFHYSLSKLIRITHADGAVAYYNYENHDDDDDLDDNQQRISMFDGEALYGTEYILTGNAVTSIKEFTADSINSNDNSRTYGTQVSRTKNGVQETLYRYDGNDRELDNEDDLITRYTFDFAGRTINATTLDSTQNTIYGVTAAAYTSNSGTSQQNNRIEKDTQTGQAGVNMLIASGGETHDSFTTANSYWQKIESGTGKSATVKTGERARTGSSALKIWLSTSAAADEDNNRRMGIYQSVTLQGGETYTFSAYANTGAVSFPDTFSGGVYIAFLDSNNAILKRSTQITTSTELNEEDAKLDIENGWQRLSVTFTVPKNGTGTYRVAAMQENVYNYAYFDDLQLEKGNAASSANLIQDGTFTFSRNDDYDSNWNVTATHEREWNDTNLWLVSEDWYGNESNRVGWIIGNKSGMKRGWQTVPINGPASETYLLSGWAKASSAADTESTLTSPLNNTKRYFGMIAQCNYTDNTKEYFYMPFNDDYTDWQYASCVIAPKNQKKTIQNITVYMAYDYNINNALFDNISLRKEPCTTYSYDSKGNLIAVNATSNSAATFTYASGTTKLTSSTVDGGSTYQYEYNNSNNNHLVTKIKNDGVSMAISYDTMGNSTKTTLSSDSNSSIGTIQTSAGYSADGSLLTSQTNANGQTTSYGYSTKSNSNRLAQNVTDARNTKTYTTYTSGHDRILSSYISGVVSVGYSYENGMLSQIRRGGYINQPNSPTEKQTQAYNLSYDSFGNMTSVAVGSRVLASYQYAPHNGSLESMTYGNGHTVSYEYDELGRTSYERWNGIRKYQYLYSAEGNLAQKLDLSTGETVYYEYDSLGRLIRSSQSDTTGFIQRTEHLYDKENRISRQSWQAGGNSYTENYTYNTTDGSLTKVEITGVPSYAFSYDALKRLSSRYNYTFSQSYTYQNRSDDSTKTTMLVSKLDYTARPAGTSFTPFSLNYTYDATGNITSVTGSSITGQNASYSYDAQGQLIQETNATGTYQYNYDTYGNIRSVKKDGATIASYGYGDSEWLDKLTVYNSKPIGYDAIGNPENWYSETGEWKPHWENGRQLSWLEPAGENTSSKIEFTYDLAGIRSSKKVGNTTYHYITQNGKVIRQTWGSNYIDFIYDNNGNPYALKYNDYTYFYVLNQQGDVIKVINYSGAEVASYTYDAWGNILSKSGWMADANPLRYRGYYYDKESGLYYLQSRYYDPVVKRFINSDKFASTGQGFLGYNMFAYCLNCPTNNVDHDGALTRGQIHNYALLGFSKQRATLKTTGTTIYYNKKDWRGGVGFCDLYDSRTGEVWELKRNSKSWSCKTKTAKAQLKKYVSGRLKDAPALELKEGYTRFESGTVTVTDWTGRYDIKYWEEGDGILRYDYTYTKDKRLEYAEAAVTVVAAGVVIYATGGAGCAAAGPALGTALGILAG